MVVLQLPQGYYRNLTGMSLGKALVMFDQDDAEFLAAHPQCIPYHRPCWQKYQVDDAARAPWGHEWYLVQPDGTLIFHSAHYDSSG